MQRVSVWFANPSNLACFLIMDPRRSISVSSALRYWGCTTQAGGQICGAFGYTEDPSEMHQEVAQKFMPLSFSLLPFLSNDSSADWSRALSLLSQNTKEQLRNTSIHVYPSVSFDSVQKSVTLFMPGFDKSEIKLYQVRPLIYLSITSVVYTTKITSSSNYPEIMLLDVKLHSSIMPCIAADAEP